MRSRYTKLEVSGLNLIYIAIGQASLFRQHTNLVEANLFRQHTNLVIRKEAFSDWIACDPTQLLSSASCMPRIPRTCQVEETTN